MNKKATTAPVSNERSAYFLFELPDKPSVRIAIMAPRSIIPMFESSAKYTSEENKAHGKKKHKSFEMKIKCGIMLEFSNRQRCASQKMSGFCPSASCCSYALWASLSSCDSTSTGESSPA